MRPTRQLPKAAALALAAVLALSGCSALDDFGRTGGAMIDEAAMNAALAGAEQQLEALDGVTAESGFHMTDAYVYSVGLSADIEEPTPELAAVALEIARSVLSEDVFAAHDRLFVLTSGEREVASLGYLDISKEQLAAETEYLVAFEAALGAPVSMRIDDFEPGYHRHLWSEESLTTADLSLLQNVDAPTTGVGSWSFPGISATGSLPSAEAIELLRGLERAAPLIDTTTTVGVQLSWTAGYDFVDVSVTLADIDEEPLRDLDDWPMMLAVADVVADSPVPVVFLYYSVFNGSRYGTVTVSACEIEATASPADEEFLDALDGRLPSASAGYCA